MKYDDFIVLLARQRSGTNPLRAVLGTNPHIFCFNEVFSFGDRGRHSDFLHNTNFFTFLEEYADDDVRRMLPDRQTTLFADFLEYLRCFATKRYLLIDVKYNSTHFLTMPWKERDLMTPDLFKFIRRHQVKVLHVTRRNYLRYILSIRKARESHVYAVWDERRAVPPDLTQVLPAAAVVRWMESCRDEDQIVEDGFREYDNFFSYDYADIFTGAAGGVDPAFLEACSEWLGVPNEFKPNTIFKKQSSLPLSETIENYCEIETALRGTEFEYCLEDEQIYGGGAARAPARAG